MPKGCEPAYCRKRKARGPPGGTARSPAPWPGAHLRPRSQAAGIASGAARTSQLWPRRLAHACSYVAVRVNEPPFPGPPSQPQLPSCATARVRPYVDVNRSRWRRIFDIPLLWISRISGTRSAGARERQVIPSMLKPQNQRYTSCPRGKSFAPTASPRRAEGQHPAHEHRVDQRHGQAENSMAPAPHGTMPISRAATCDDC